MTIYALGKYRPELTSSSYAAPTAVIIGNVIIGERSSVWFNSVVRADDDVIQVGDETNIQDLCMVHVDPGSPAKIGNRVTIGHRCVVHGCRIDDDCLIGMGSVIMNRAVIGTGSIVAAGSVVLENVKIPPFSLVTGTPAKVKKTLEKEVLHRIRITADVYVERINRYKLQGNLNIIA
jgi:carbonic anhydrase/acetyltransferase-like protein (isoleucine patch superfamily)